MTIGDKMRSLTPIYVGLAAVVITAVACGGSKYEPSTTPAVFINPTPAACQPYHIYLMFNYKVVDGQVTLENLALSGKPDSEFPNEVSDNAPNTLKFVLYTADGHEVGRHVVSLSQMASDSPPSTAASLNNFSRQPLNPLSEYLRVIGPSGQMPVAYNGRTYAEGLPLEDLANCID